MDKITSWRMVENQVAKKAVAVAALDMIMVGMELLKVILRVKEVMAVSELVAAVVVMVYTPRAMVMEAKAGTVLLLSNGKEVEK
nr:MAG TPA: hypothetical protein [Caudoviricetes sp.]